MDDRANNLILHIPYEVCQKDAASFGDPEAVETTQKRTHQRKDGTSLEPPGWGEQGTGRSASHVHRLISNARSIACANSSWHNSASAQRLHVHNPTFTTTHFPPSLSLSPSNTLGVFHSGRSLSRVEEENDFPAPESLGEAIKLAAIV